MSTDRIARYRRARCRWCGKTLTAYRPTALMAEERLELGPTGRLLPMHHVAGKDSAECEGWAATVDGDDYTEPERTA